MYEERRPMSKVEVLKQVKTKEGKIKNLILLRLKKAKFPVGIKKSTLKFKDKRVDVDGLYYMNFVVQCQSTRWITDAFVDGWFAIDLRKVYSGDNLMHRGMVGEWNLRGHFGDSNYRVNWK